MDLDDGSQTEEDEEQEEYGEGRKAYEGTRISTGADYIDRAMRGGIPLGSVTQRMDFRRHNLL